MTQKVYHTPHGIAYHIVFASKFRRKIFYLTMGRFFCLEGGIVETKEPSHCPQVLQQAVCVEWKVWLSITEREIRVPPECGQATSGGVFRVAEYGTPKERQ